MNSEDIAVVGMACCWPGVDGPAQFWRRLVNGMKLGSGTSENPFAGSCSPTHPSGAAGNGGAVQAEGLHDAERNVLVEAIAAALQDAGIGPEDEVLGRTDLIVLGPSRFNRVDVFSSSIMTQRAVPFADPLRPMADCLTLDSAAHSLSSAIEKGVSRLCGDLCDAVVVCSLSLSGGDGGECVSPLSGEETGGGTTVGCREPITGSAAAGALLLKRRRDAESQGDGIYAILKGLGGSIESNSAPSWNSSLQDAVGILEQIYRDAAIDPGTIGFLEVQGPLTDEGSGGEVEALKILFGPAMANRPLCPMGSARELLETKPCGWSMASLIKTILCVSHKIIPPGLPSCDLLPVSEDLPFYVNREVLPWIHNDALHPRRAAVSEHSPGGVCTHILVEEASCPEGRSGTRPIYTGLDWETELVALTADSLPGLRARALALLDFLQRERADASLPDIAYTLSRHIPAGDSFRIVMVCKDLAELKDFLAVCSHRLESGQPDFSDLGDIYFTSNGTHQPGRVVCIFPGLTFPGLLGTYSEHLRELCLHFPQMRAVFDKADNRPGEPRESVPIHHYFFPPEYLSREARSRLHESLGIPDLEGNMAEQGPANCFLPSFGVAVADWANWALVKTLGLRVDMLFGHSIGELVALCAAEAVEFESIVETYWALHDYWKTSVDASFFADAGRLAFVHCEEDRLKPLLERFGGVTTAIYISPGMRVLGGEETQLKEMVGLLQQEGILSQVLPYPAIHTPHSRSVRLAWEPMLERMPLRVPGVPVYSAASADIFPEDVSAIRAMMQKNAEHPLRLWQATQRFYQDGARIFIQLGGGDTLYSQVKANLGVDDVVSVATDVEFRSALTQINHFCALLLTNGVTVDPACLFRHRLVSELPYGLLAGAAAQEVTGSPAIDEISPPGAATYGEYATESRGQAAPPSHAVSDDRKMPFVGSVAGYRPQEEVMVRYRLDIDEDIFLRDHVFVHAPGVKPVTACNPVLPMAVGMEMMAEAAACLVPGHGLIGLEDVKALKWIHLEDADTLDLRISARVLNGGSEGLTSSVQAEIFVGDDTTPAMASRVLLGRQYLLGLQMEFEELLDPRPNPISSEKLYRDRHLFHGPLFQCIAGDLTAGDQGLTGEVRVLSRKRFFRSVQNPELLTEPAVMDGIAQLVGVWAMNGGMSIFPIGIEKVEMYRTPPAEGRLLPVRIQALQAGPRRLHADVEVQDGEGAVWMRFKNFKFWVYRWPSNVLDFRRFPTRYVLSMPLNFPSLPQGAVCRVMPKSGLGDFDLRIAAQHVLHVEEMEGFKRLARNPVRQRQWLLGRIAAKDAVRLWLARERGRDEMLHPAAFVIEKDSRGQPFVRSMREAVVLPRLSITHSGDRALAVAHRDGVGIDMEHIAPRETHFLQTIASDQERLSLEELAESKRDEWTTRLWCAKEAMGKFMGTGLEGTPKKWRAVDMLADGTIRIEHNGGGRSCSVKTLRDEDFIVALAADGFDEDD